MVVENELERAEKRIDVLTFENSKLKDEIRTYSNELKSFEAADEQYSERETQVGSSDHLQFFSIFYIWHEAWVQDLHQIHYDFQIFVKINYVDRQLYDL